MDAEGKFYQGKYNICPLIGIGRIEKLPPHYWVWVLHKINVLFGIVNHVFPFVLQQGTVNFGLLKGNSKPFS